MKNQTKKKQKFISNPIPAFRFILDRRSSKHYTSYQIIPCRQSPIRANNLFCIFYLLFVFLFFITTSSCRENPFFQKRWYTAERVSTWRWTVMKELKSIKKHLNYKYHEKKLNKSSEFFSLAFPILLRHTDN